MEARRDTAVTFTEVTNPGELNLDEANDLLRALLLKKLGEVLPEERRIRPERLQHMVDDPNTRLIVARKQDRVLGMAVVVVHQTLNGPNAILEDLVVLEVGRGLELGLGLLEKGEALALGAGAKYLEFTSGTHRLAANRLYQKAGYVVDEAVSLLSVGAVSFATPSGVRVEVVTGAAGLTTGLTAEIKQVLNIDEARLAEVNAKGGVIAVARRHGSTCGLGVGTSFEIPAGSRAWIDHIVGTDDEGKVAVLGGLVGHFTRSRPCEVNLTDRNRDVSFLPSDVEAITTNYYGADAREIEAMQAARLALAAPSSAEHVL